MLPELKTCTKCKESKSATLEFFIARPARPCGLTSQCRVCLNRTCIENRARAKAVNPDGLRARDHASNARQQAKRLARLTENPLDEAEKERLKAIQRAHQKNYRERRREDPAIAESRRLREAAEYKANEAVRLKKIESARRYREENAEKVSEANKARYRADREAYYANNHRRRARIKGSGGSHTAAEWRALKARYDHRCLRCNRQEPEVQITRDHIVPIIEGGTNDISNIQLLCRSCNAKKATKTIDYRPKQAKSARQTTLF